MIIAQQHNRNHNIIVEQINHVCFTVVHCGNLYTYDDLNSAMSHYSALTTDYPVCLINS